MILNRALWVLLPIAATMPLACNSNGTDAAPIGSASAPVTQASAPASASAAPSAAASADSPHEHGGRHFGIAGMIFHAARDLDLKPAQKTAIDKVEEQLKTDESTPRTEFKDLHADLMTGLKAGKIDLTKLEPRFTAIEKAIQDRQAKQADALNAIYAALEPAQRKTLTAAIRAKQAEREAKQAAHAEQAAEKKGDAGAGAGDADWAKRRLDRMTKELGLDDGQQKSIAAIFAKGDHPSPAERETWKGEMKKRMEALLTAFEGDGFDAKKIDTAMSPAKKPREPMERMAQFLSQLAPILKQDQRDKLAAKMEAPPPQRGMGPPHDEEQYGLLWDDPQPEHGSAQEK